MNNKDKFKLDVLSRIDEEIIDRNTKKRIELLKKTKKAKILPKVWIPIGAVAACLVIMLPILFMLFGNKQVPVYTGMSVSSSVPSVKSAENESVIDLINAGGQPNGGHGQGNGNGNKVPVSEIIKDEYLPNDSSLTVDGGAKEIYYAKQNEDIYITVHVNNPDAFEILSFTLNGQKYTSYMFEPGSDLENLILKVNVGNAEGIVEYTIDAIKYVDGTEIKDVKMEGDRTVKVGVYTDTHPTVAISNEEIGFHDVSFDVKVTDTVKLIELSGGSIEVLLCDESSVIDSKKITIGKTVSVKFEGLDLNSNYGYAIVASYDRLDGEGFETHILYENIFTTKSAVDFSNINITSESVSFNIVIAEEYTKSKIDSISLIKNGEKIKGLGTNETLVAGLLSDNEYTLVINFTTSDGVSYTTEHTFKTLAKAMPIIETINLNKTQTGVSFEISETDIDGICEITKIYLVEKNGSLVKEFLLGSTYSADGLTADTQYELIVEYKYDLNDGAGRKEEKAVFKVNTMPKVNVLSVSCINTGTIYKGDKIVINIKTEDMGSADVEKVKINGVMYFVSELSSSTNTIVEIAYDDQFKGGETELLVEELLVESYGEEYSFKITENNKTSCFVYGEFSIKDATVVLVDENGDLIEHLFPSTKAYFYITLDNPMKYEILSVEIFLHKETLFEKEDIIFLDSDTMLIPYDHNMWFGLFGEDFKYGLVSFYLKSVSYTDASSRSQTAETEGTPSKYVIAYEKEGIVEVSTPDDLKNMSESAYYKLMNDIDLSGYDWSYPGDFAGFFDGNGHTISGINVVKTYTDAQKLYLGLFGCASGKIANLNVKDIIMMITVEGGDSFYYGGVVGGGRVVLYNVSVDSTCSFTVTGPSFYLFVGAIYETDIAYTGEIYVNGKSDIMPTGKAKKERLNWTQVIDIPDITV